jgi:transposase-like protein
MCTGKLDMRFSQKENQNMTKRRYSAEFKKETAHLMIMDGLTAGEVSEKLGVNSTMLYRWYRGFSTCV